MASHAEHVEHPGASHHHPNYVRIWAILLVLLVVSVVGPMAGIQAVTLITAFGIAVVKAYLVAKNFMHLDIERKFVVYILVVCLGLMVLFFFAVAPDVMKHYGVNWENYGASNKPPPVHHEADADHGAEGSAPAHGAEAAPAHGAEAAPAGGAH